MNAFLSTGNFSSGGLSVNIAKITDRLDMTSSVYRGRKTIIKQTEETMKTDIVAPPLILHFGSNRVVSLRKAHLLPKKDW